jgi:hypothetical protein
LEKRGQNRSTRRLQVETLETRAVPATFVVTNVNDSNAGSLRAAINSANASPTNDTIQFNIAGSGIHTISLASELPAINASGTLMIDGWSQPGFAAAPLIQISAGSSNADYGLSVFANGSTFRGLIINGFKSAEIALWGGDNNKIQGNYFGSNAAGNAVVGSTSTAAVYVANNGSGAAGNIIGVDGDGVNDAKEPNLIVGSSQMGVWLNGSGTNNNRIAGNRIGISSGGVALPNEWGVYVSGGASSNFVGSNNDGQGDTLEGNTISGNLFSGVAVVGTSSVGNRILRDFIYGNCTSPQYGHGKTEIDLEDDGLTLNDNLDADIGGNGHANYPILHSLTASGSTISITGVLNAKASTAYTIQVFAAATMSYSGYGGSQRFLGAFTVSTNASGAATYSKSFAGTLAYGWVVSATATDVQGNTSEFSPAIWQGGNLDATFTLHSNPSATKVIYLDFNGQTITGTQWNTSNGKPTITVPAYSIDSSAAFRDEELFNIQRIFHAVAEDFKPFNVDVTTAEPPLANLVKDNSGSDTHWGKRVAIGGTENGVLGDGGGAGGLAYVGSFNWNIDTPAFVFADALKPNDSGATLAASVHSVADAISHETGHTLGLSHDGTSSADYYDGHGTGATSWGPIMGDPYSRSVSQWSKGQYTGANNTEDDLAIITTQNGFGYRTDDYGNTPAAAAALSANAGHVYKAGIIERNTDVDLFSITVPAGKIDLSVLPDQWDANLDVQFQLLNASGQQVAISNSASTLSAHIVTTVAAGKYYLRVDGVGVGTPLAANPTGYTDYGSLGFYVITGTVPTASGAAAYDQTPVITLSGTVGYTRNASTGVLLAPHATVTDADSTDFSGGKLIVSITAGGEDGNRLMLTGGAFMLGGTTVNYNGSAIGTVSSNGIGTAPLSVLFNSSATPGIVQELVRGIRFRTVNSSSNAQRTITFSLSDGGGGTSNTATKFVNVTS